MHEVNAAIEEMRKDHDPLASHIFVSRRVYQDKSQHQERQAASFVGSAQLAAGMRSRISWRPRKVGALLGGSSASVRATPACRRQGQRSDERSGCGRSQTTSKLAASPLPGPNQSFVKSPRMTRHLQMRGTSTRFLRVHVWGEFLGVNTMPAQDRRLPPSAISLYGRSTKNTRRA
jgi:hypothetical protein